MDSSIMYFIIHAMQHEIHNLFFRKDLICCLTSRSSVCQLYYNGQFYLMMKSGLKSLQYVSNELVWNSHLQDKESAHDL